jgi:hypothetical protein
MTNNKKQIVVLGHLGKKWKWQKLIPKYCIVKVRRHQHLTSTTRLQNA